MPKQSSTFGIVKNGKSTIFQASLYDINNAIKVQNLKERPLEDIVAKQYHEFFMQIRMVITDQIPSH